MAEINKPMVRETINPSVVEGLQHSAHLAHHKLVAAVLAKPSTTIKFTTTSPAAEVGNPASLYKVIFFTDYFSLICNNIQIGVEFLPLGN